MNTAIVSAKGWIVIPKDLREKYGIQKGTHVQVVEYGDILALVPVPSNPVAALQGMLQGGSSLIEDLLQEHAAERAHEDGSDV